MKLLTHYASKNYIEELSKLAKQSIANEELIHNVNESVLSESNVTNKLPYQDDLLEVLNYLRVNPEGDDISVVRGALIFLLHSLDEKDQVSKPNLRSSGRDTCSMIIKIAASTIRKDKSLGVIDCLSLTKDEKLLIHELFDTFCKFTPYTDIELCEFTKKHIKVILTE